MDMRITNPKLFHQKLNADYAAELDTIRAMALAVGVTLPAEPVYKGDGYLVHALHTAKARIEYRLQALSLINAALSTPNKKTKE